MRTMRFETTSVRPPLCRFRVGHPPAGLQSQNAFSMRRLQILNVGGQIKRLWQVALAQSCGTHIVREG